MTEERKLTIMEKIEIYSISKALGISRQKLQDKIQLMTEDDADKKLTEMFSTMVEPNTLNLIAYCDAKRHSEDILDEFTYRDNRNII